MKAISIQQPWAWLIINGPKGLENRNWRSNFRGPVLIHAGLNHDTWALQKVGLKYFLTPGFILWLMERGLDRTVVELQEARFYFGGIVGKADVVGEVQKSVDPWFSGPNAFVLEDRAPLPFVQMRGQLNFFEVPDQVVHQLGLGREVQR
jgi:hypothetical protein